MTGNLNRRMHDGINACTINTTFYNNNIPLTELNKKIESCV